MPAELIMKKAARILEGSFYALSLAEGYVVFRRSERKKNVEKRRSRVFRPFLARLGSGLGLGVRSTHAAP